MKQSIIKDERGKTSSKRVTGLLLIVYALVVTTLDGFDFFDVDATIIISLLSLAAAMLSLDSVTDIWKQNSGNNGTTTNTQGEPD
jgi:hypothetical protein